MFAGKTSKLLEEAQHVSSHQGDDVLYLKSSKDNRYSESHIATHTGIQVPCFAVSHLIRDVLPGMDGGSGKREGDRATPSAISQRYASSRVVAIDEAQFFGEDLVEFCTRAADDDAKTVVVAGLDGDFLRGRFGHVLDLVPLSDSVVKLRARCAVCGERAVFSRKIDGDLGRQEEIGSSETMSGKEGEKAQVSAELQQFIAQEQAKAQLQQTISRLTDECWDKCVSSPSTYFSGKENACLDNCAKRFMDTTQFVIKYYNSKNARGGGGEGFDEFA